VASHSHLHSIGKIAQSGSNLTAMCGSPFAEPVVRSIPSTRNSDNIKDRLAFVGWGLVTCPVHSALARYGESTTE
jgi:hypothetical protein